MRLARISALAALLACACACAPEPVTPTKPLADPTEADACERFCDRLQGCAIAPPSCSTGCVRDQKKMREGVYPSFVACVERELAPEICAAVSNPERRDRLTLCWTATVEAWAARAGDDALGNVVHAVCVRRARCEPEAGAADACELELKTKLAGSGTAKMLAVARPDLVATLATCVEQRPCDVDDPVAACSAD